jgi:4-amino-4-deoxy-L-arabinose transferase-like glycosyltransferase
LAALVGSCVAALITLPGLGTGTLWDNSETAYGEVAREILLTGDAIVMHLNGADWFVQPPLYFWIAAAFAHVFGIGPFALRLPPALATIAMAGVVGYTVARVATLRTAILSAVILSTTLMVAIVGRLAIMDALLDLAVAIAVLAFYAALRPREDEVFGAPWILAWVAMAFGVLAKGPIALLATALVIGPWLLWEWRRDAAGLRAPSAGAWLGGVGLFVLIAVPWYVALAHAAGPEAVAELLGHYSVGRYLGTIENQTGPVWYYVPVVILGFFPWFAFLPPALWRLFWIATAAGETTGAVRPELARLVLVWAIVPLVFFSFAETKLPNYIALEFPALAIGVAVWFDSVRSPASRRVALAWTLLVPASIGGLAFAIGVFSRDMHLTSDMQKVFGDLVALGLVILAGSAVCFGLLFTRRTAVLAPYALACSSALSLLIVALIAEPHAEPFKPIPALAKVIMQQRAAGDRVAIRDVAGGNALIFYTLPPVATTVTRDAICRPGRTFVVAPLHRPDPDPTYGRNRRIIAASGNDALFLYDGPPCVDPAPMNGR